MRAAGAAAGAGLFGVPAVSSSVAAQSDPVSPEFLNVRVREALHAWNRGYRGRTDRTLAQTDTGSDTRHPDVGPWSGVTATTENGQLEVDGNPFNNTGGQIKPQTTKLVGWHNDYDRYGGFSKPRDDNGHGTHVASIMAGSGRASAIDPERYQEDDPHALLLAGDTLSYEVTAAAGTGVFASAYGDAIELVIEAPDGSELATSGGAFGTSEVTFENNIAETPTVHADGDETYTVRVRAIEGELISTGRIQTIAVGAFKHPSDTVGDRTADGDTTLHAGIAPNASILSLTDLSRPTRDLGKFADQFVEEFNVRAVNMSWGYIGGLPLGATGLLDDIPDFITKMAESGMLTVAAAGNSVTPANGNGSPAVANEAVSVVATGPYDGIASYSSGGLAGIDDFENPYMKPDVSAPGGLINVLDIAARSGEPEDEVRTGDGDQEAVEAELEPVRHIDQVTDDQLAPKTTFDPAITGDAGYEIDLATEVEDALLLDDAGVEAMRHGAKRDGMGGDGVRGYTGKGGTSMASPSVCGIAGVVSQAMEEDAPGAIALPEPVNTGYDDVLRLKSTILATATETALTAAPYHRAKAPVYTHGRRDPYEGFGRANVGPAIDAATRDVTDASVSGTVGLAVPDDERAVAGHVRVSEPGEVAAEVAFSHYSGGNAGATKGDPHIDLFLYDAQNPDGLTGDPTIVASDAGIQGDAAVSASVSVDDLEANGGERVFYVVAKLVNVPGLVNGFDCRAHLDLSTAFDPAGLVAEATRDDSGSVFTGGQTNRTDLDVTVRNPEGERVIVRDRVPEGWNVDEEYGDVEATTPAFGGGTYVYFGLDDPQSAYQTLTHFAEAPSGVTESDRDTFGPVAVSTDTGSEGTLTDREWTELSGTEHTVTVVAEET